MSTNARQPFGAWLKQEMQRQGYEVDGPRAGGRTLLAKKSGISLSIVSRILNEDRVPEVPALRALGKALGYSLGEMLIFAGLAETGELPEPVVRVSQPRLTVPDPPEVEGLRLVQLDETRLHVDLTIDTEVTMAEVYERLGDLSANERAMIATMEAIGGITPAQIGGAVFMLRRLVAHNAEQTPQGRQEA